MPADKFARIDFSHFISNKGAGSTGPMWVKRYTNDPLRMTNASVDEAEVQITTASFRPAGLAPSELPGKLGMQFYLSFHLAGPDKLAGGPLSRTAKYDLWQGQCDESARDICHRGSP